MMTMVDEIEATIEELQKSTACACPASIADLDPQDVELLAKTIYFAIGYGLAARGYLSIQDARAWEEVKPDYKELMLAVAKTVLATGRFLVPRLVQPPRS